jgi:hypothetical protein
MLAHASRAAHHCRAVRCRPSRAAPGGPVSSRWSRALELPGTAAAPARTGPGAPADVAPSQWMNHRRSPNHSATWSPCRAARQIVLLPIPGAPSTATGSGGVASHAATSAATSNSRPTRSGRTGSLAACPATGGGSNFGRVSCRACSNNSSSCSGLANLPAVIPESSNRAGMPAAGPAGPSRRRAAAPAGSAPPRPHPAGRPAVAVLPRPRYRTPARYGTPPAGPAPACHTATRSAHHSQVRAC